MSIFVAEILLLMTTYTKFKEYIWLVNTIYHAKAIALAEINEKWLQTEMSEGISLSRTTFHRHRIAIEEMFALIIECDKKNGTIFHGLSFGRSQIS